MTILRFAILFVFILFAARDTRGAEPPTPKLAVVIVVDQLSAELFDRLSPVFSGGFHRFSKTGVVYKNARHDHALTQTGPGHFTLLSGRHPGPAGIPANEFFDRKKRKNVYCVDDPEAKTVGSGKSAASFRRIETTSLGDWLKAAYPPARVFSVAGKDRAAVLMGGRNPDGAFWFDPAQGSFTTSTYYSAALPESVKKFNELKKADRYIGKDWTRELKDAKLYEKYAGPDAAPGEDVISDDEESPVFPHRLALEKGQSPNKDWYENFMSFPWMDELTLDFARHLVESEKIGADATPDLLCVSLSGFDLLGHTFGPHSQEVMDAAIRIDRELGDFLNFLDQKIGKGNWVAALSSDHGGQPLSEWARGRGIPAARVGAEVAAFRDKLFDRFRKDYPEASKLFLFRGRENLSFDHEELAARKIRLEDVCKIVRDEAARETWIAAVYDRPMLSSPAKLDAMGKMVLHSFYMERGFDVIFIPKPYYYTTGGSRGRVGTNHGTPHDYDSRIPMMFIDPSTAPATSSRDARTIDLAPSLAARLGIPVPKDVDGNPMPELGGVLKSKN